MHWCGKAGTSTARREAATRRAEEDQRFRSGRHEKLTDDGRFVVAGETLAFGWKGEPFGPEELAREPLSALFEHI